MTPTPKPSLEQGLYGVGHGPHLDPRRQRALDPKGDFAEIK
jgi:hypothetical protein